LCDVLPEFSRSPPFCGLRPAKPAKGRALGCPLFQSFQGFADESDFSVGLSQGRFPHALQNGPRSIEFANQPKGLFN
jgi:hypothetical protein